MHKKKLLFSTMLRSGLLVGVCTTLATTSACEECSDGECISDTQTSQTTITLSSGTQSSESSASLTGPSTSGAAGGDESSSHLEPGSTTTFDPESSESSIEPDSSADTTGETDSSADTTGETGGSEDLKFTFVLPGISQTLSARVVGGANGSSIVVDKFPDSYGFRPYYNVLPMGYPDLIDEAFCQEIEETVEIVEKDNAASGMARASLRESYPFVNLKFPFASVFTTPLFIAARDAARGAGATASALQIANGPEFQDVELSVSFAEDALTRRMGDDEKARKELQSQLGQGETMLPGSGAFLGGTNWPDLLCDLYSKRAQMSVTFKEEGWSSVAKSETIEKH